MPAVVSRGGGRRRSMNEINMVPFIDVMLVLLIIFMVCAPMISASVVDLPSVGKARQRPQSVIEVIVNADASLRLRLDKAESETISLTQLANRVLMAQNGNADMPVVISADKQVRYESVVQVMDSLQRNGVLRVGLSVKQGS